MRVKKHDELRSIEMIPGYLKHPWGSVLISFGDTKVICTAMVEEKVPPFLKGTDSGWVTAEYNMLPGSTITRKARASARGKTDGRATEIQRLIGRSLRSVVSLDKLGEHTIWIDCDVIQADGGTRTAAITGGFVAMALAMKKMKELGMIKEVPLTNYVAAVSVGVVEDQVLLDLCYEEDAKAMVDMNVVMTDAGAFIEVQGTGEERPFSKEELDGLLAYAEKGIRDLIRLQEDVIGGLS